MLSDWYPNRHDEMCAVWKDEKYDDDDCDCYHAEFEQLLKQLKDERKLTDNAIEEAKRQCNEKLELLKQLTIVQTLVQDQSGKLIDSFFARELILALEKEKQP